MATLFSDNYNRADTTNLGANYTEVDPEWEIFSNKLRASLATAIVQTTTSAFASVADMKCSITSDLATGTGGPIMRATGNTTYYFFYSASGANSNTHEFYKNIAGTLTQIWVRTASRAAGAILRGEVQGSTLRAFIAGVQVGADATDTEITAAGQAGVYDDAAADWDDLLVEDFASAAAAQVGSLRMMMGYGR